MYSKSYLCQRKSGGFMILTAIFIILFFASVAAVVAKLVNDNEETEIGSVMGEQANLTARGGAEFAMMYLFPLGKSGSADSDFWNKASADDDVYTYDVFAGVLGSCSSSSYVCGNLYDGCTLTALTISAEDIGSLLGSSETKYEYTIVSEAACTQNFVAQGNVTSKKGYSSKRKFVVHASDIRWR